MGAQSFSRAGQSTDLLFIFSAKASMASKHVINEPRELVNESLKGLARLNPSIKVDEASRVVVLAKVPKGRVALVRILLRFSHIDLD